MNKPPQKYKPFDKKTGISSTSVPVAVSLKKFFTFTLIITLAAVPFVMGRYYELYTPDPFDSASNVYSAKRILDGARIGIDEIPSAALGTLLVNILGVKLFGFSEFGPKLIQAIFQAAALILMLIAMRKLFGTLAAAVGVIVASTYLSFPYIAKFGNVKEQYMIACMVMGISCFILYQLDGRRFLAPLAGAFLIWAPLFKETGTSALGALGLFLIAQPFLKNRSWKQTLEDIALIALGAILAIAPLYIWIIGWDVHMALPYSSIWKTAANLILPAKISGAAKGGGSYVAEAWKIMPFSQLWPRVLRFCLALILPVALAVAAISARLTRLIRAASAAENKPQTKISDRFILLLAVWWLLDMAFACISPRSYEQYYLPLNASAAFLGGYFISLYSDTFAVAESKIKWLLIGAAGLLIMIVSSWHIFFGIEKSPYSGMAYGEKRKGFAQSLKEVSIRRNRHLEGYWEHAGDHIRQHSAPTDKIYVWGWYPGIYVQAQRFSSSPKAFESEMHIRAPQDLAENIKKLLEVLRKENPKFIVDSRKRHLPLDRPPFELWPVMPEGFMGIKESTFLPADKNVILLYDKLWIDSLRERFGEDETLRYEAFKPFRDFVMTNYHIVKTFGDHVVFELNIATEDKEQK